jgi:hypothetical protein
VHNLPNMGYVGPEPPEGEAMRIHLPSVVAIMTGVATTVVGALRR